MITLFVFAAIGALIGWFAIGDMKVCRMDYAYGAVMAFVCALMFLLVGSLAALLIGTCLPSEYVLDKQIELVEMQDTAGIQGNFFLSTDPLEPESHYYFYQKEEKGFRPGKVPFNKAVVYEEQRSDGLIKIYEKKFTSGWLYLFGSVDSEKYEIFIPQGSILPQFHPDHPDSE